MSEEADPPDGVRFAQLDLRDAGFVERRAEVHDAFALGFAALLEEAAADNLHVDGTVEVCRAPHRN